VDSFASAGQVSLTIVHEPSQKFMKKEWLMKTLR
jgi:hypothetical protein